MRRPVWPLIAAALLGCSPQTPAARPAPPPVADVAKPAPPVEVDPMDRPTPIDSRMRVGTLANGLTYYIMPHHKPEQRAALWLAVNAGSVLEDEDQRGLAHFVEHMAFNGTKRFPKADIVNYIERIGMRFGADLNASTSFDETVYKLTVPTDDQAVMFKGLDILRDWAGDVTFDPVEVDKERGVVLEEWRLGRGANARIDDKQFPIIFQGSKYAERLPIGKPEILKTAKRDTLYRFYKDWYRPELMAVIAIGDFDPAMMEKEIQARFADLKSAAKPRERAAMPVPHDHDPAVTIATDPELRVTSLAIYDKMDHRPEASKRDYRRGIVEQLYFTMLNARFAELRDDPASPFVSAGSGTRSFLRTADMFTRSATVKENRLEDTLRVMLREIARVEKYGFLASELERARKDVLTRAERAVRERDKNNMLLFVQETVRNFLRKEQMPGPETELAWTQEMLPAITLDELNHLAKTWGGDKGRVIAISAPASAKLPNETEVRAIVKAVAAEPVEAWQDAPTDKPFLATPPVAGKIVKTAHDEAADATIWTLSNGIRVIVKPTTFRNDEVSFTGWMPGGTSVISEKDFANGRFGDDVAGASGAGEFDPVTLRKMLAGKVASVNVGLGELSADASGFTRPADLETAMQVLYLKLTAPRRDERAFGRWKAQQIEFERHRKESPEQVYSDAMIELRTSNHPRRRPVTAEDIEKIDLDKALAAYKARFADLSGFTFVFVGNVDIATLQPLVETYIASLPGKNHKDKWRDIGVKYPTGKVEKVVTAGTEPKSRVEITFAGPDKWTLEAERDARVLEMALRIRLREVLREDMGGVYGVSVGGGISREPTQRRSFTVSFGCDPANVDKLRDAVFAEIGKIQKEGVTDDYIAKITETLKRSHETELKENRYWEILLRRAYYYNDEVAKLLDVDATIKRVTNQNIKASAKRFFDDKNTVIGVLKPKS